MRKIYILHISLILFGVLTAEQANAGGEDLKVRCGLALKSFLQKIHDPWTKAALNTKVDSFRQTVVNHDNIVVVPLWKMQGMDNPVATLRSSLSGLKESGVQTIYMPPMYKQSVYMSKEGYPNYHGYWPIDFELRKIDPKLGKNEDYLAFLSEAKAAGFQLALDIDPRHLGYVYDTDKVTLWGKEMNLRDPTYFNQTPEATPAQMAQVELLGPAAMHVNTDTRMWDLNALNVENPWVREKIIQSHVEAIDLGYSVFRVDSAKHMRSDFIRDLLTAMSNRGAAKGVKPKFILEYFSGNYGELAYKLSEIGAIPGMTFIDFPRAGAVRKAVVNEESFDAIRKTVMELEDLGVDNAYFTQAVTDQDGFYPPIYHGTPETECKTYAALTLSNMTSTNRPYYVAGLEQAEAHDALRNMPRKFFDNSSPPAKNLARINQYMNENFMNLRPFTSADILVADQNHMVIKRMFKDGKKSVLMVLDRSHQSTHINAAKSQFKPNKEIFRWGEFGGNIETYLAEVAL